MDSASVSRLNCGLCRDRGTVLTSSTRTISLALSNSTKEPIDRFECPMVQTSSVRNSMPLLVARPQEEGRLGTMQEHELQRQSPLQQLVRR